MHYPMKRGASGEKTLWIGLTFKRSLQSHTCDKGELQISPTPYFPFLARYPNIDHTQYFFVKCNQCPQWESLTQIDVYTPSHTQLSS